MAFMKLWEDKNGDYVPLFFVVPLLVGGATMYL